MKNRILFSDFNKTLTFVKPLYRKAGFSDSVSLKTNSKLRNKFKRISVKLDERKSRSKTVLPGCCEATIGREFKEAHCTIVIPDQENAKDTKEIKYFNINKDVNNHRIVKSNKQRSSRFETNKHSEIKKNESWLRVLPASKLAKENMYSIVLRCFLCQLGLTTFLFVWTSIWVFVIRRFEEPYEIESSRNLKSKETQLVIDLATELRQITPLSTKWLERIEERMSEQKRLTETNPGIHTRWDLYGTIFFLINIMVTLVMNASKCTVARLEKFSEKYKHYKRRNTAIGGKVIKLGTASIKSCENIKIDGRDKKDYFQWKIVRCFCAALNDRGILLTLALYYVSGAIAFGGLRRENFPNVILFPLVFHTSGDFVQVAGPKRILYGLYVEGAIFLLACTVVALRRRTKSAVRDFFEKYRLIIYEENM